MIKKSNTFSSVVMSLGMIFIYLSCDRLCRDLFLWNCSYRMKTVNRLLSIGVTTLLFLFFFYRLLRANGGFSWGVLPAYSLLYLCFLVPTVLNSGATRIGRWADSFFFAAAPLLMISLICSSEEYTRKFISAVVWLFLALVSLNLLFALFPGLYFVVSDWDQENFIAYHSILCFPLTIGVMFALLDSYYNSHQIKAAVYLALFFANQIVVHAGGALIGMAVVAVYLIPFVRKIFEKWDLLVFVGAVVLLFVILMWGFNAFISFPPVEHLVADVLHKELNLSGRTGIWSGLLQYIYQKPFLGYGLSEGGVIYFDPDYNNAWVHAHNEFIQTLYEGGIVSLLCALGMLGYTARILRRCKDKRAAGIFKMTLFSLLLMLQNDQLAYYPWYIAAFACHTATVFCSGYSETAFPALLDADLRRIFGKSGKQG